MTDFIDFLNSHPGFFEADVLCAIEGCGQDNKDYSTYVMEHDESSGNLVFHNLYTDLNENIHKDIVLNLGDMSITERIHDNKAEVCYENYYKLDGGVLSFDEKKVTFNMIPKENNHSKEFDTISIRRA